MRELYRRAIQAGTADERIGVLFAKADPIGILTSAPGIGKVPGPRSSGDSAIRAKAGYPRVSAHRVLVGQEIADTPYPAVGGCHEEVHPEPMY